MSVAVETLTRPLTKQDRCDGCNAEAKHVARMLNDKYKELFFCDHHAAKHKDGLLENGFYFDIETIEERN